MSTTSSAVGTTTPLKNVVVLGASYVGLATYNELVKVVNPETHRVLLVEPNSHFGHFFAIAPGHEHKAFIPLTSSIAPPNLLLRAKALSLTPKTLTLDRPVSLSSSAKTTEVSYEALVLATGTRLAAPGSMPGETKLEGVAYLQKHQKEVEKAEKIVILGGGAVGVQMATDIAILYPLKSVTVIHSRQHLMPRFHPLLHQTVAKRFADLGIKTVLRSRAVVPEDGFEGKKEVVTLNGEKVEADFVIVSTGQTPNSAPLFCLAPSAVAPSGFISVDRAFSVAPTLSSEKEGVKGVWAVGDIADSGAPKAARPGMAQAAVVAHNIASYLSGGSPSSYQTYTPDPAAIHLTLGIVESIIFRNPPSSDPSRPLETFTGEPTLNWKDDGVLDMNAAGVWSRRAPGLVIRGEEDYHL